MKAKEKQKIIREEAIKILENTANGLRYSEIVKEISNRYPNFNIKEIQWAVWDLDRQLPDKVYKPGRGLFRHIKFKGLDLTSVETKQEKIGEDKFYKPFAEFLVNETEEATKAIPLGGNRFKDRWGTPDVIGIKEPSRGDIIQVPTEVISAEIKSDTSNLITAFGQACSYKLFSHKVYLVIPKDSPEEDISRLDSLCIIFGIGLVLFDANNSENPKFEIRVRPVKHEPDIFYTNRYLASIKDELFR
ncbi:MAG: hypothetical protein QXJ14_01250 [Candidatus Aenigmatarchaeota archaeon]